MAMMRRNDRAHESKKYYEARQARKEKSNNEQGTGYENDSSTDTKPASTTFTGFSSFTPKPSDENTTTLSTTPTTTKTRVDASNESSTSGEPSDDVNNNDKSDPLQKTLNKDEISLFECESASDAVSDMTFNRRMSSK